MSAHTFQYRTTHKTHKTHKSKRVDAVFSHLRCRKGCQSSNPSLGFIAQTPSVDKPNRLVSFSLVVFLFLTSFFFWTTRDDERRRETTRNEKGRRAPGAEHKRNKYEKLLAEKNLVGSSSSWSTGIDNDSSVCVSTVDI